MPAAHPYSVEVGCCLFDRLEKVVIDQAENSVVARRRRRRGFLEGSPSRPPVFCVQRQMPGIWHSLA